MANSDSLMFRRSEPSDREFLIDSFVSSYRTAHAAGLVPMEKWQEQATENWAWVLARPGVEAFVACHPTADREARADLYGYIVIEREVLVPTRVRRNGRFISEMAPAGAPVVHFCYVKNSFRRQGLARALFNVAGISPAEKFFASTKTGISSTLAAKVPNCVFNPLIARYSKRVPEDQPMESK